MAFEKATKEQRALKLALFGPSGAGKTMSALKIATAFRDDGQRIALIDTERSSASLYADQFDFDTVSLTRFRVDDYVTLINEADAAGYGVLIIDSISHAWEGKGGILEEVERIKKSKGYRDGMRAWNDVKSIEGRLWDTILDASCSVIVTMRSKTSYEISKDEKGKTSVEKLGLAPVQRADKEYEFDVVGRMDTDNTLIITKTRCQALMDAGGVFEKPDGNVSRILKAWLSNGAPAQPKPANANGTQQSAKKAPSPEWQRVNAALTSAFPEPLFNEASRKSSLRAYLEMAHLKGNELDTKQQVELADHCEAITAAVEALRALVREANDGASEKNIETNLVKFLAEQLTKKGRTSVLIGDPAELEAWADELRAKQGVGEATTEPQEAVV